jgi:hypothetical protein
MAEALREAYQDLFLVNERPSESHKTSIEGKFKAVHGVADNIAGDQARTFFALLKLADLDAAESASGLKPAPTKVEDVASPQDAENATIPKQSHSLSGIGLRYNIEVHLPATKDVEVYNAIFKSLKEHLLDH